MNGFEEWDVGLLLRAEWAVISTGRRARDQMTLWSAAEPELAGLVSPAAVLDAIEGAAQDRSIEMTQAVLRLAATHVMAKRLLMQVMVPTLATEAHRTWKTMRASSRKYGHRVKPSASDAAALILDAIARAIDSYAGRTMPYPIRSLRRRFIELVISNRMERLRDMEQASSFDQIIGGYGPSASPGSESDSIEDWADKHEPTAAEVLADTLQTAVDLGIVSTEDAALVWGRKHRQISDRDLASNDHREAERLRRRRSRAQRRMIDHRADLLAAGVAV